MSSAPKLTTYKFRVLGGSADDPTEHEVRTVGRDVQRTEEAFATRGWGQTTTRPMTSAAMVAYFGMVRMGTFTGKWEDFENWYLSIEPVEPINATPTDAGAEPA